MFRQLAFLALLLIGGKLSAQQPNIIFIFADDLGYGSVGAYGQQKIKTPHIDGMAKEGMKFTNFYANSLCAPSRASLITGLSTAKVQIRDNYELGGFADSLEFGQMPLAANSVTFPLLLKQAGYTTALIGKWGLGGPNSTGTPNRQGFDFFYGYLDQKQAHNHYPSHLWRNEIWEELPNGYFYLHQQLKAGADPFDRKSYEAFKGPVYASDTLTSEALKFIKEHRSKPFMLYLSYTIPHLALQVPEESLQQYLGKFEETPHSGSYLPHFAPLSAYAAMITRMDSYIGDLLKLLKELEIDENTLVIFTSDNGPERTGNNIEFFNAKDKLRGEKGSLYEGGIRVPFIVRWPGKVKSGVATNHIAALWDMLPTFCEIAGISVKNLNTDGISILPELTGNGRQEKHSHLYWETHRYGNGIQAVRFGNWKAVRSNMHKAEKGNIELYNLETDIEEKNNVAAYYPQLIQKATELFNARERAVLKEWNFY